MLEASRRRIAEEVGESALVLDVGGWADPLARADCVIDLMPYETRGLYERRGWVPPRGEAGSERFTEETWIQRDLCAREPYPFADDSVDFVVCSHTLEDLRDPLWVCSEMVRIAKAGYIEVPSRLEEQSWGVNGGALVGWPHHRWLIDAGPGGLTFAVKPHDLHHRPDLHFPAGFWERLSAEERVETLWWTDGFSYKELAFVDESPADSYLPDLVRRELAARGRPPKPRRRLSSLRRRPGGS